MDPVAALGVAGTAVVGAMATDAWRRCADGVVELWRRVQPERVPTVEAELIDTHRAVVAARRAGDAEVEEEWAEVWRSKLRVLLRTHPGLAADLQRLVDEELRPALPPAEQTRIGQVEMKASATGSGRVYQAGRDQHIHER